MSVLFSQLFAYPMDVYMGAAFLAVLVVLGVVLLFFVLGLNLAKGEFPAK